MSLLQRLKFAWQFDVEQDFIVMDFKNQCPVKFTNYADARKFSESQLQYRPAVMVKVWRRV